MLEFWAADSLNTRVQFRAERDRSQEDGSLLREEMRIKDARMASLPPHRRPYYAPADRLAILEVRAARGWSLEKTAEMFLECPKTVGSWIKRLEEDGSDALVQLPTPVNKFPDFVRYTVQRLQTLCLTLGKKKLAEVLARAGLHLGTTTIGRIRQEKPIMPPSPQSQEPKPSGRTVTAKRPNHVWHVDLTIVPTEMGFWCPWSPLAWPQCWPFCCCSGSNLRIRSPSRSPRARATVFELESRLVNSQRDFLEDKEMAKTRPTASS
jgi:hypothetical protein